MLSILSFFALVSFPAHSFAQLFAGGGVEGDPYIIEDCDDLESINLELEAHYKISDEANDLECLTEVFPIARQMSGSELAPGFEGFKGVFDGNDRRITYNIESIGPEQNYVGLFGYINGATIKNLDISISGLVGINNIGSLAGRAVDSSIIRVTSNSDVTAAGDNIGGLIGTMEGGSSIVGSSYEGTIDSEGSSVGGLVGRAEGVGGAEVVINRSYVLGEVSGINRVGGLVGQLLGSIENSYADAGVNGQGYVGGLVGMHTGGNISNTYSHGAIFAEGYVGGIVGQVTSDTVTISNSFAATNFPGVPARQGAVVGDVDSTAEFNNSYWDLTLHTSLNECYFSSGFLVEGCSAVDTTGNAGYWKDVSNQPLGEWDFSDIWTGTSETNYPKLLAYSEPPVATQPDQVVGLTTSGLTETSVVLGWTTPADGGSAITDYSIRWRILGGVSWTTIPHAASTNTQINLTGLTAGTTYEFQVAAVNAIGFGPFSNPLSFTTTAIVVDDEPERSPGQKIILPTFSQSASNLVSGQLTQLRVLLEKMLVDLESTSGLFTRDLYLGMYGSDVKKLQEFLVTENTGPASLALGAVERTEYFGVLTQAAVAEFQRAHGITPDEGYFGPKTRTLIHSRLQQR
ncbi:MAG TPA: fibronectin type III domain-containing protein [Candidatus Nanoarchaeia archaeon]|nr:fibronectin type III domain-containing protein [Candidatus Nanoarchaeia archaeon]